jgi:hypothetical protein
VKASSAGLDVALLDLGRIIHTGNRAAPQPKPRPAVSETSAPIELGDVIRPKDVELAESKRVEID